LIIVYACLAVLSVEAVVLRGRLLRLANVRLRRIYLVWLALGDQVLVISVLPGSHHLVLDVANSLSYVAAGVFVWSNRRIPGLLFVALGGGLNAVAIAANGGTMPATTRALAASRWRPSPGHFANSAVVAHPHLALLGDIFATPRWLPGHDVFSIGDVVIVAAFAVLVYRICVVAPLTEERQDEKVETPGVLDPYS
jgi:hypothetical protein